MTWHQLRNLSEEWHDRIHIGYKNLSLGEIKKIEWKSIGIEEFTHTVDDVVWEITEITNAEKLYYEGKEMLRLLDN